MKVGRDYKPVVQILAFSDFASRPMLIQAAWLKALLVQAAEALYLVELSDLAATESYVSLGPGVVH